MPTYNLGGEDTSSDLSPFTDGNFIFHVGDPGESTMRFMPDD